MIKSFRHRGLERLYEDDNRRGIRGDLVNRVRSILARLDIAETLEDLALPGYRLHALKGDLQGLWSVSVNANWRIVFRFESGSVFDVDLVDYH